MRPEEREALFQDLLEHHYGCHEDPERIEALLAANPEARALMKEVRRTAATLDTAAREETPPLRLRPPARRFAGFMKVAAAIIVLVNATALANWGLKERAESRLRDDTLHLVVSGPPAMPEAATSLFDVRTTNAGGDAVTARLDWKVLDLEDREIAAGSTEARGQTAIALDPKLANARKLVVSARYESAVEETVIELERGQGNPLFHVDVDKPIYRPGETVYVRGVALNRVSLEPVARTVHYRLLNPKGNTVQDWYPRTEKGVATVAWPAPEDAAGGRYALEVRSADDSCTLARREFTLRRFERPQFRKTIVLDRESYLPGATGTAAITVERIAGGAMAGAAIEASLVIDGETLPVGAMPADAAGRAVFAFAIPERIAAGDARFVARIADSGRVETGIKPFLVPTGRYELRFYPEGGELVAGVANRLYFEATDPLDRPVAVDGSVLDEHGRELARATSRHQGRGLVSFVPEAGRRYRLVTMDGKSFELPAALPGAVALDASGFSAEPQGPARVAITTPDDGPFVVGLFCRGFLVESRTFRGAGEHAIDFELPEEATGVLRLTVFDRQLAPLAERLVHRRSAHRIEVAMTARQVEALPGSRQEIGLVARDETGRPLKAILGLTVSDQSVRDLAGEHAVGLADALSLTGDVEALEEVETFLVGPEAEEHVDLLLGTRGWRRFAWHDPAALLEREPERGRALLAREGRADLPRIAEAASYLPGALVAVRNDARQAGETLMATAVLAVFALVLIGLARLGWRAADRAGAPLAGRGAAAAALPVLTGLLLIIGLQSFLSKRMDGGALIAERAFAPGAALEERDLDDDLAGIDRADEPAVQLDEILQARAAGKVDAIGLVDRDGAPRPGEAIFAGGGNRNGEEAEDLEVEEFFEDDGIGFRGGLLERKIAREGRLVVREYAHRHRGEPGSRSDFAETVYWNALIETDEKGEASVAFDLSDSVTTWTARVDAHGQGRVGQAELRFDAVLPLSADLMAPIAISSGDRYRLPITVSCRLPGVARAEIEVLEISGALRLEGPESFGLDLDAEGRGRALLALSAGDDDGEATIRLAVRAGAERDEITRRLRIARRGFPRRISRSGLLEGGAEIAFALPRDEAAAGLSADLVLYPSALSILQQGLEGMLREPYGCFEQTSSVNYPNVMALRLMESTRTARPEVAARARELIGRGYARLTSYECKQRGYEWFGGDPGHEALSAYGLLEFHDMKDFVAVDPAMMERTRSWLLDRRDGRGGFERNPRALDRFGSAPKETTDAYVVYALARTGTDPERMKRELDRLAERAQESDDAYEVALAAGALQAAGRALEADGARERLKGLVETDGSYRGLASITRSGKADLAVETTAFAVLAYLDDPDDTAYALNGVRFLLTRADGGGCFGATQATVMALMALSEFAGRTPGEEEGGEVTVVLNGEEIARKTISGDAVRPLVISNLAPLLRPGENRMRLEGPAGLRLPFAFDLAYFAEQPANDPDCPLELGLTMAKSIVREGETTAIRIKVTNRRGEGLPMTMVAVGLPGNLEAPTAVLEDLKKAGRFDYWEIRDRDLFFYWRDLAPEASEVFQLDCVAKTPGLARGAASRAWLYYAPQETIWHRPLEVEVTTD